MKRAIGPVIGMLHVPALPGSPNNELSLNDIIDWVLNDAGVLARGGIHALMIENFGDTPFYPGRVPAHTVAYMTALAREVKRGFGMPMGINILRNDVESAIAVASAVGAEFVRVNVHTGARLTDQGLIEGTAHQTLRYRKLLGSDVLIFADVDVKHSAPVAVRPLSVEVEELIARGCADGVIVTGAGTGKQTELGEIRVAKQVAGSMPVYAGSGVNAANIAAVLQIADGAIVGTSLKRDGITTNPVDPDRVRALMDSCRDNL
jgi:membrane complex biogenesis BtpA family protein